VWSININKLRHVIEEISGCFLCENKCLWKINKSKKTITKASQFWLPLVLLVCLLKNCGFHPINFHRFHSNTKSIRPIGCSNIASQRFKVSRSRWSYNFADFGLVRLKRGRLSTTIILILPGRIGFLQSTVTGVLKPIIAGDRKKRKRGEGGKDLKASLQYFLNFYFL